LADVKKAALDRITRMGEIPRLCFAKPLDEGSFFEEKTLLFPSNILF
jgi:hypothetical protein